MSKFKAEFEQLEVLGRGGFGIVFKVRHRLLECTYAVKAVVLPDDAVRAESVLREVRTLARMQHPNIVRFYACWVEDGLPDDSMDIPRHLDGSTAGASKRSCVIFESAEVAAEPKDDLAMPTMTETEEITATQTMTATGNPGRKLVGSWKVLYMQMELCLGTINPYLTIDYDAPVRMALFGQLLRGVGYLHQNGIVHNDLKPSNLLMHHQHLKIADFGLITDSTLPAAFRGGTPLYVPPETARGTASDVFSLGIIFVEFLCAPLADRERVLKRVRCGEIPTDEFPVLLPFKDLILTMVSNNPAHRPNIAQLQQQLRAIGAPTPAPSVVSEQQISCSGSTTQQDSSGSSVSQSAKSVVSQNKGQMSVGAMSTADQESVESTSANADKWPDKSTPSLSSASGAPAGAGFSQSRLIADLEAQLEQLRTENVLHAQQTALACDARDVLQKQHNTLVASHKVQTSQQAEMKEQMKALNIDHAAAEAAMRARGPSRDVTREISAATSDVPSASARQSRTGTTRTRAEMQQMVGFVPDAALITDVAGIILCCNAEVKEDFEYEPEELEGLHMSVLLPDSIAGNTNSLNTLLTSTAASRKATMRSVTKSGKQQKGSVQCKRPKGGDDVLIFILPL